MDKKLRIACVSDTHRNHTEYTEYLVQGGFLVVHSGDADCTDPDTWRTFINWALKVSKYFKHGMVFVPGNHDTYIFENLDDCREELKGTTVHLLVNEERNFEGFTVFGSPYVQPIGNTAYNAFTANGIFLEELWENLRFGLDLVVTHGPASGVLDSWYGDPWLFEAIRKQRPKIHVCGHVHSDVGVIKREHTLHVNAAVIGTIMKGPFEPIWIEVDPITREPSAEPPKMMSVT